MAVPPPEGPPHPTGAGKEAGSSPQGAQPTIAAASAEAAMASPAEATQGDPLTPPDSGAVVGPIRGHFASPRGETRAVLKVNGNASASEEEKKRKWAVPHEHGALADGYTALGRFEANLGDADRRLAKERVGLASAWLQADATTKKAWSQAKAATAEHKKEAAEARGTRDEVLAEAATIVKHCGQAEAGLKALQEEQAREAKLADRDSVPAKVVIEQAAEHLTKLQEEVTEAQESHAKHVSEVTARLDAREKILADIEWKAAADRDAFSSLEFRARQALRSICRGGFEDPLATPEGDYVELSSKLTTELEGTAAKVDSILEEE
nr:uncharacterized protein LOC109754910 [Aegilops tauschii subsp. strangulata]